MARVLLIEVPEPLRGEVIEASGLAADAFDLADGSAHAIAHVRRRSYDVLVTSPGTSVDEDLALVCELWNVRPGVRPIVLARESAPEEVVAALRARVFACFAAPFTGAEVGAMIQRALEDKSWFSSIEVLGGSPTWLSVRADCRRVTAERVVRFLNEFRGGELIGSERDALHTAFREVLLNAVEHGAGFRRDQVVQVTAIRTGRALVFYVHDPGPGFDFDSLKHAAVANPDDDPLAHLAHREAAGMRGGGFGILLAKSVVDELIYSEAGNEVILIKYLA